MITSLDRTRPWVTFLSGLLIVGCILLVLAALAMVVMGGIAGMSNQLGSIGGAALGGAYFLMALLYLFPALYLRRYGQAIKRVGRGNQAAVEEALEHQASFWRYVGILAAVITALYAAILVIGVIAAVVIPSLG